MFDRRDTRFVGATVVERDALPEAMNAPVGAALSVRPEYVVVGDGGVPCERWRVVE